MCSKFSVSNEFWKIAATFYLSDSNKIFANFQKKKLELHQIKIILIKESQMMKNKYQ